MERIVLQPNGKYAIFSTIVDNFIAFDGTPDEIKEYFRQKAVADSDRICEAALACEAADQGNFDKYLKIVARVHGLDMVDTIYKTCEGE